MRGFAEFANAARVEPGARSFKARYIVTPLSGDPRHHFEAIYCARGQAENLIKQQRGQLDSDRTSCQSLIANQFRVVLYSVAYWLMLALRDVVPRHIPLV